MVSLFIGMHNKSKLFSSRKEVLPQDYPLQDLFCFIVFTSTQGEGGGGGIET